jgi:hypothetical protein
MSPIVDAHCGPETAESFQDNQKMIMLSVVSELSLKKGIRVHDLNRHIQRNLIIHRSCRPRRTKYICRQNLKKKDWDAALAK